MFRTLPSLMHIGFYDPEIGLAWSVFALYRVFYLTMLCSHTSRACYSNFDWPVSQLNTEVLNCSSRTPHETGHHNRMNRLNGLGTGFPSDIYHM